MLMHRGLLWFLFPSLLVLSLVLLYPLAYAIYLSLFDYYLAGGPPRFIGAGNYLALLSEARFWDALLNTVIIALGGVGIEFLLGLTLALGLYRLWSGAHTFLVLLFLPHIITPVVAALLLRWIFVGQWGLIDATMWSLGVATPNWLGDPFWAKVTVILADAWKFAPFMMLVLYAGLQGLDESLIEAAMIDGADGWQLLVRIILPILRPLILFVLSIRVMDAFRTFDTIYVMTGGGPGTATETLALYTYAIGFTRLEVGRASALGVLSLAIVAGFIVLMIFMLYRREKGQF
jgi:multiple sugar transport system permease protein